MTAYETALKRVEETKQTILNRKHLFDLAEEIKAAMPHLKIQVSHGMGGGQLEGVLLRVEDLDDIRDVIPVCKAIMDKGLKPNGYEDFAELKRRTYDYGDIKVLAFIKWQGGSKCDFRQVGVEQKPVYKLVCEEGETTLAG